MKNPNLKVWDKKEDAQQFIDRLPNKTGIEAIEVKGGFMAVLSFSGMSSMYYSKEIASWVSWADIPASDKVKYNLVNY